LNLQLEKSEHSHLERLLYQNNKNELTTETSYTAQLRKLLDIDIYGCELVK